jgi:hypothetical protein
MSRLRELLPVGTLREGKPLSATLSVPLIEVTLQATPWPPLSWFLALDRAGNRGRSSAASR